MAGELMVDGGNGKFNAKSAKDRKGRRGLKERRSLTANQRELTLI